ncbi:MAG: toll/interleukin-1 receptor domain-containing protein [Gemmatimonadota bacterium]|nr:MAG: toll/interleukin-1 receptor domain-containing protein [Gemmatimonadota bacterium]
MESIRQLIAADRLEKAVDELIGHVAGKDNDLSDQLTAHQAQLSKTKKDSRRGLITTEQENQARTRVRYAILELLPEIEAAQSAASRTAPASSASKEAGSSASSDPVTVFISYNHSDREVADRLKAALEREGIRVRIDREAMKAGQDIKRFIENSIRETDVTISIVSNRSLLSAWVALETINTFHHETLADEKKFIACYIDDDFFKPEFLLAAADQIDARIAEIDEKIPLYIEKKLDTIDLNSEKSRLFKLRNNLGEFLVRLRESLTLDIRAESFDRSAAKIVSTIREEHR